MNRSLSSLIAILVLLLGGYGGWRLILSLEPALASAPPRDVGAPRVTYETLVPRNLRIEIEAFGNLEASRTARLTAELGARVVEVFSHWRPGAEVRSGELLVRLDASLFALDVSQAEAALAEALASVEVVRVEQARALADRVNLSESLSVARRQYERQVELGAVASDLERDAALLNRLGAERAWEVAEGAVAASEAALASARARVVSARAALARAEEMLGRTQLRAPFDARLRGHAPGLGTLASPGLVLAELLDPESLVLGVHVPERDLLLLKPGMKVRLSFPNTPETHAGASLKGRVSAVDVASDPMTRRGLVEIELDKGQLEDQRPALPSGLFARAVIELEELQDVLWIDRRHLRWEGSQAVAYVLGEGPTGPEEPVAKRRVLTLWREHGEGFVVAEGLVAGEQLIVQPLDRMSENLPLIVTKPLEPGVEAASRAAGPLR